MHILTHAMVSWMAAQPLPERRDRALVTAAGVVADLDGLSLIAGREAYERFHHTFGHSVPFALGLVAIVYWRARQKPMAAALALLTFHLHLGCDLLGSGAGWGIRYFWPFSEHAWESAPPFQWELDGWQNVLVTLVCLIAIAGIGRSRGRTILEVISAPLDQKVVRRLGWRQGVSDAPGIQTK